jgi:hypothetical protein
MDWTCSSDGETMNTYRILVGKTLGKRPLKTDRKRGDNIKMALRKTGCEVGRWIKLPQDSVKRQALILTVLNRCVIPPSFGSLICDVGVFP